MACRLEAGRAPLVHVSSSHFSTSRCRSGCGASVFGVSAEGAVFLGVDLASVPARTAMAGLRLAGDGRRMVVEHVALGIDDDSLVDEISASLKAGIDVPFGWPQPFVDLVQAHAAGTTQLSVGDDPNWRRSMAMRTTDLVVRDVLGLVPLSVSTDRIAYPALRWSALEVRLREAGVECARDGTGRVCEVYPAAALRSWGLSYRGYKGTSGDGVRERLVESLARAVPWLEWNGYRDACVRSDDMLDAVLAALVAHEVHRRNTRTPSLTQRDIALREGWIHLPTGMPDPPESATGTVHGS